MKKIKTIVSGLLIGAMMMSFAGCASVKARDKKEVKDILKEKLELKKDKDFKNRSYDDYDYFYGESGKAYFSIYIYDDEDDAADVFDDLYDSYEDDLEDDVFDGKIKLKSSDTSGYVTFKGECTDDDAECFLEDEYYYGGVYYADNMVIRVSASKDKDNARDDVNAFLKAFGLPKP
ncbi:MAG: hypothetical protein MJ108_04430 [Saccharofermentans sp.]|nr:hypothetical protein [Saccharofermentans sp.]